MTNDRPKLDLDFSDAATEMSDRTAPSADDAGTGRSSQVQLDISDTPNTDGGPMPVPEENVPGSPAPATQPAPSLLPSPPVNRNADADDEEFLPSGLPSLPPLVSGTAPRDEATASPASDEQPSPGTGAPDASSAPAPATNTPSNPVEPVPTPAASSGESSALAGARTPRTAMPAVDQSGPSLAAEALPPQPTAPDQAVADQPAPETQISRVNLPRLTAFFFPTTILFTLPYSLIALLNQTGLLSLGRWRIAGAYFIAIGLWLIIVRLLSYIWRFPDVLPDWVLDLFNAVNRRTGIAAVDRSGLATCIALAILSLFISPWLVCLCAAGALGFLGSLMQPVLLWPVGWEPIQPPTSDEGAPDEVGDALTRQPFEWNLERGLGIRRQISGQFSVDIDMARYEMLVADTPQQAGDSLGWRTRAEWLLARGSTEEVTRAALALYQMRKDDRLTDYEDVANALSLIHQCFTNEDQTDAMWRAPLATLQDRRGTSADLSLLLAALLRQLGRPCQLLYNPKELHMAVAVSGAAGFPRELGIISDSSGEFFFCETTQKNWLPGEVPSKIDLNNYQRYLVAPLTEDAIRQRREPAADVNPRTPTPAQAPAGPPAGTD